MNPTLASQATGSDPLAGLRGYHLPDPVSWWPPAPGWWLLVGLLLAFASALAWWALRRRRQGAAARQALRELLALRTALEADQDRQAYVRGLSRLLRRFALTRFSRSEVAGLTGDEWLAFLDAHGGGRAFQGESGRQLCDAPYRPQSGIQLEQLESLVERWIRHNREARA